METKAHESYLQSAHAKLTPVAHLGLSINAGVVVRRLGVETVADFGQLMPLESLKPGELGVRARREIQQKLERAATEWIARPRLDAEQEKLRDRVTEACFPRLLGQAPDAASAFQAFEATEAFLQDCARRRNDGRPAEPEGKP
jgi:hypothetical protein